MEKDIIKLLKRYLRYWYLFLIGAIICSVLAFLHLRYEVISEYYISGKILLNDKEEGSGTSGLESLSSMGLLKMSRNIQDEIGVLQSYDLMKATVSELGFNISYFVEGRFSEVEVYEKALPFKLVLNDSLPVLQYGTIGSVTIIDEFSYELQTINEDGSEKKVTYNFGEELTTDLGKFHLELKADKYNAGFKNSVFIRLASLESVATNYNNRLQVFPVYDNGGGLLQLGLTDAIPQRGVDLINTLIEVYAKKSAEHKNILAESTVKLIDERLELLTNDLNSAEKGIENFKQNNALTDVSSDAARYIMLADEADSELSELRTKINALNTLEKSLLQSSNQSFSPITVYNVQNSALVGAIVSFNQKVQNRNAIISDSGIGNPLLPEIDRQLRESMNIILENIKTSKTQLISSQRDLANKSAQFRSKISSVPSAERALIEISRDQGLKQNLYLFLLQKKEEEALSISVPFSDTRIIEEPRSSGYPINGSKMPVYLGAILLGVFIPFVWVFTKDILNTKISSKEDVEAITNNSILATIASNKSEEVLVVNENNKSPVAELFRLMRHNLKFYSPENSNQVIMVTSSTKGEGKTFVSINLAASLAITGKKVVVIGFDLRVPKLMKNMKLEYSLGVSDYIVNHNLNTGDIIIPYKNEENLHFIGSGPIPPNPGELILSSRTSELIETLKKEYDYIIIDTPPIGKVSDAHSLRLLADSTLFVVRSNFTNKEELKIINEVTKDEKQGPLMIVLNDVKIEKSGAYSYGYGNKSLT